MNALFQFSNEMLDSISRSSSSSILVWAQFQNVDPTSDSVPHILKIKISNTSISINYLWVDVALWCYKCMGWIRLDLWAGVSIEHIKVLRCLW